MSGLFGASAAGSSKRTTSTTAPMIASWRPQTAVEGGVIALVYGRNRISANIIYAGNLIAIPHTTYTQSGGGGGGKGGGGGSSSTSSNTTYSYIMEVIWGLCEGLIQKIGAAWFDKNKVDAFAGGVSLGARPQSPIGWLISPYDLGYYGLALAHNPAADMGDNASLPNWSFEIYGLLPFNGETIPEANPAAIIPDFLSNLYYGAGLAAAKIASLTQFSNYCVANGFFLSPALQEQKEAREHLADLLKLVNSEVFWSEGKLNIVPMGDEEVVGNGVTFTPNLTPVLDLDLNDFLFSEGEEPVQMTRKSIAECYNSISLEYLNRDNSYNTAIAEAKDQAAIEAFGLRKLDTILAHAITDGVTAGKAANNILQYSLYARNQYKFSLGVIASILDPLDWVTLTYAPLGLNQLPVRIFSITESDDLSFEIEAVEWPVGTAHAALYPHQGGSAYEANFNADPGNINPPVIFEPPALVTNFGFEVWIAASGGSLWGGAEVWISIDNATYKRYGRIINPARTGKLRTGLPAGSDPDQVNTLAVDLTESRGELLPASQEEADKFIPLCYVDGELVAYRDAALVDTNKYDLTYLRRGLYGTINGAHPANAQFARIDGAVFKYPFVADDIGQIIYLKFLSFNIYGGALQALEDVEPYQHEIGGGALEALLPDVTNLIGFFRAGQMVLKWDCDEDPLDDYRQMEYEIRRGAAFNTAEVLARVKDKEYVARGDGFYWVAARTKYTYSTPATIEIANSFIVANVVVTHDEKADGWPGTLSGGVFIDGLGFLEITGSAEGYYTIPTAHRVDLGAPKVCNLSYALDAKFIDPTESIDAAPDWDAIVDFDGNVAGLASCLVQVRLSQDGSTWGAWQDLFPGQYVFQAVDIRLVLLAPNPPITPVIMGFAFTVDMPDRVDVGNGITCPAGGLDVTYATAFQSDPPNVQITVLNPDPDDKVTVTGSSKTTFHVAITNGGSGVERTINWLAQGY